ncbi:MAG: hypothetical protein HY075_04100 [Deltaproteobacteria bacterium]|nr:hypothetical protein [Deltaproteobacteria bacterium]
MKALVLLAVFFALAADRPAPASRDSIDAESATLFFEDAVRAVKGHEVTFRSHPMVLTADAGTAARARKLAAEHRPAFVTASLKKRTILRLDTSPDPKRPRD